jgi:N-acetylglucosaminyl-diphospho-decaprenol L-rhamnosyltransferase
MTTPTVAVVTVTYRSEDVIRRFLSSVAAQSDRVVIADNSPSDSAELRALAAEFHATLLRRPDNPGYGAAVNAGIATLPPDAEFVLIANPDVQLGADAVPALLRSAAAHPNAGAFGPRILDEEGTVYPSARELPSLRAGIGHALFGTIWPSNPWSRSYRRPDDVTEREAGWLSGACMLVRVAAFRSVGGFDEGYFMYFEDVDLGARLAAAGWSSRYVPDAVVIHSGAHSTRRNMVAMASAHHRSAYRFVSRKYAASYFAPLRLALRIGIFARERFSRLIHH